MAIIVGAFGGARELHMGLRNMRRVRQNEGAGVCGISCWGYRLSSLGGHETCGVCVPKPGRVCVHAAVPIGAVGRAPYVATKRVTVGRMRLFILEHSTAFGGAPYRPRSG